MTSIAESFSSIEVAKACGISYRKLDYWVRQGYVRMDSPTPGSGQARRFTFREALRVKVMAEALKGGIYAHSVRVDELIEDGRQDREWSTFRLPIGEISEELRAALAPVAP